MPISHCSMSALFTLTPDFLNYIRSYKHVKDPNSKWSLTRDVCYSGIRFPHFGVSCKVIQHSPKIFNNVFLWYYQKSL